MNFSDTTNRTGIVQLLEDLTLTGGATDTSYPLATKVRDLNMAYNEYMAIANDTAGNWQVDDTNQTDYPIITFDIVSGQDNYAFNLDGSTPQNQITRVFKLRIKDPNGMYIPEVCQIDRTTFDINQFQNVTGTPQYYDITSNGVILYPTPNYNSDEGGELYVARTPVQFTTSMTTTKPGIPWEHHRFLALYAAYWWTLINLPSLSVGYRNELYGDGTRENVGFVGRIRKFYSTRNKSDTLRITTEDVCPI